eukprot:529185-Amphidinium_carterae.1
MRWLVCAFSDRRFGGMCGVGAAISVPTEIIGWLLGWKFEVLGQQEWQKKATERDEQIKARPLAAVFSPELPREEQLNRLV